MYYPTHSIGNDLLPIMGIINCPHRSISIGLEYDAVFYSDYMCINQVFLKHIRLSQNACCSYRDVRCGRLVTNVISLCSGAAEITMRRCDPSGRRTDAAPGCGVSARRRRRRRPLVLALSLTCAARGRRWTPGGCSSRRCGGTLRPSAVCATAEMSTPPPPRIRRSSARRRPTCVTLMRRRAACPAPCPAPSSGSGKHGRSVGDVTQRTPASLLVISDQMLVWLCAFDM